ncbi:PREDICTED: vitellogenin-2-like [Acromyrmex echinatior]|nr:PREDICTED: vitellogenin-2-like [Acromyrmex echinatior]
MWFPVILLLAGVAVVTGTLDHEHAWEKENEYEYLLHSRTLAGLDKLKQQYTGLQMMAKLIVHVKSPQKLQMRLSNPQYAHLHTTLMDGPETELPDHMLEYRKIPMSGKPFEVTMKHGVIRDLLVNRDIPTWELNLLKSFVSLLQIDTQGENAVETRSAQIPVDENSPIIFTAVEDSIGGRCEVLYEILPLDSDAREISDRIPLPDLRGEGYHYDVKKMRNYEKCLQRQVYRRGLEDPLLQDRVQQDKMILELSSTRMLLSGHLKKFTIQSVVTKNHISVRPEKTDPFLGNVHSVLKLTLLKKDKISRPLSDSLESTNLESTGNLIYTYNNPFSDSENPILPSVSMNSEQIYSSERTSSSEKNWDNQNSFSRSSSDEDQSNILPKRMAMPNAPKSPLLRLMTVTNMEQIKDLILEIATAINSSNDTNLSAMEQYVFLKNFVRIMSLKQIDELEERLRNLKIQDKDYKNVIWSVLRDTVAQVGTEPALLTIHNWLKNKKVEGLEAAKIVSQIARHVNKPTKEYVRMLYEMVRDPSVLYQTAVNVTAPLALAQVIRKYHVNTNYLMRSLKHLGPTLRNNVPTHIEISNVYIPFMTEQLKQGLDNYDTSRIQVYIMALGLTGHPKILSIFEPYLEDKESISKFERLLMVSSLSTLSRYEPKLVGPIFYKLYSNVDEDHRVRCMSVHRFITLNPPLITLQRIAKFTNEDLDENVISAVKTTINSLANTKLPELQDLAAKARNVRHLLNPKEFSKWNSRGYYTDLNYWGIKDLRMQTIGDEGIAPSYLRVAVNTALNFNRLPTFEGGYLVSNVRQLWNNLKSEETSHEMLKKSRIEKLLKVLQLKSEDLNKLEGHVFLSTVHDLLIYPFDSQTVRTISSRLKNFFKKDQRLNLTLFNNYETMLSFPIESGLPFLYSLNSPMVLKLKAEMKNDELSNKKKTGILNIYIANKVQKQFGFIAPFEHYNYIAGIHVNRMLHLPLEYEVNLDLTQRNHDTGALKVRLQRSQRSLTALHLSTVPFTTRQNLHDLQPVSLSRNTHVVLTEKPRKILLEKDLFSVQVETENEEEERARDDDSIYQLLLKLRKIPDGQYKRLDILMNSEQLAKNVLDTNLIHEKIAIDNALMQSQESERESQIMFSLKHVKPNSEKRRKEVVAGVSKGFKSGDVHLVDINVNLPELERQYVYTASWMDSNIDRKSKVYLYWNSQTSTEEKPTSEVCYIHEMQYSPNTPLNFKHMRKHAPRNKIKVELRYGKNCSGGDEIVVDASISRSNRIKTMLESSKVVKQCWEEIERGHNALRACQQANELAQLKNQLNVLVKSSITDYIKEIISKISDYLSHLFPNSQMEVTDLKDSERNALNIKMTLSPLEIVPPASLDSSQIDVTVPNTEQTDFEMQELLKENTIHRRKERRASCTIDKDMVLTFDKLLYPMKLGPCKHVLMTTQPQKDPDTEKNITENFIALIQNHNDDTKTIILLMDEHVIELEKTDNNVTLQVDGIPIQLSQIDRGYQLRENGETLLEFVKLPDGSVEVISSESDIKILFDGERIQLLASDRYRNTLRGLCGNYDSDPSTDFLTPQNCLVRKPEVFTATYALTHEGCHHEDILENKRKAELTQCHELPRIRQNNVINDIEAGRLPRRNELWGYHNNNLKRKYNLNYDSEKSNVEKNLPDDSNAVYRTKVILEGQEICFTIKPILTCREGYSSPSETKVEEVNLYCLPRNEESLLIKRRIEQGANPDFTRKPVSRSRPLSIPITCT